MGSAGKVTLEDEVWEWHMETEYNGLGQRENGTLMEGISHFRGILWKL